MNTHTCTLLVDKLVAVYLGHVLFLDRDNSMKEKKSVVIGTDYKLFQENCK